MKILNTYNSPNKSFNYQRNFNNKLSIKEDRVSFSGHIGAEKYAKNGIDYLISETALFRDFETKTFVRDYILKNFSNKDKIKLLIGGCSTGEEAYTYSMLLKDLGEKVSILGFDLSEKNIQSAKSGKLIMLNPGSKNNKIQLHTALFNDSFLCFNEGASLTTSQLEQKKLFDEFFEVTSEIVPEPKESLMLRFKKWYISNLLGIGLPKYERKLVKLREDKAQNCDFTIGNILDLGSVTNGEKVDILTFSNAMYHLTTTTFLNGMSRVLNSNAEETVREIGLGVQKVLNPKGLFVLGEEESYQMMDSKLVPKVLRELGFKGLNKTDSHEANVWCKL